MFSYVYVEELLRNKITIASRSKVNLFLFCLKVKAIYVLGKLISMLKVIRCNAPLKFVCFCVEESNTIGWNEVTSYFSSKYYPTTDLLSTSTSICNFHLKISFFLPNLFYTFVIKPFIKKNTANYSELSSFAEIDRVFLENFLSFANSKIQFRQNSAKRKCCFSNVYCKLTYVRTCIRTIFVLSAEKDPLEDQGKLSPLALAMVLGQ